MGKGNELIGQRFGRLEVISYIGNNKFGAKVWGCRCDCGNITAVDSHSLTSGHTRSCGCLMRERIGNVRRSHGESGTRLYHLYYGIKQRCENPNEKQYKHYGGRGIKLSQEWSDWESFRDWALANGYEDNLTLDRIDVNGNYEPSNCRWITQAEQMRNTRKTRYLTIDGETKPLIEWCEIFQVPFGTASTRFTRGWENPYEILFGKKKGEIRNGRYELRSV